MERPYSYRYYSENLLNQERYELLNWKVTKENKYKWKLIIQISKNMSNMIKY